VGNPGEEKAYMNLPYVHKLLVAADEQRHGFMKLRGARADRQVRLMAEAGLVEATLNDGKEGSFSSINRLTPAGQTFLRTFDDRPFTASQASVAAKWKANFALGLTSFM
jgi:hypothetical protein